MEVKRNRILFLGLNYKPEMIGIGKYNTEMVDWLINQGNTCTVVTAFPYYPYWQVQRPYKNVFYTKEQSADNRLTVYRCPFYVPKNPSGGKRVLQEATFFITSFLIFFKLLFTQKYDYIFTVTPPFHLGLLALLYRFFKGGKVVYHIQDLQIDAAKDLNMLKDGLVLNVMIAIERFILKRCDYVSSISPGMIAKVKEKVNRDVLSFPNWVDISNNYPVNNPHRLKRVWGFDEDDFLVLYSGSLGEKQGLDIILHIAERMPDPRVRFVLCGQGAYKQQLHKLAEQKKLDNVTFLPLQPAEKFNDFLNMADLHLILQKKDASDLVMPSKLTTILAVGGLAVATANPGTSLHHVISVNKVGLIVEPENEEALMGAIMESLINDNHHIRVNARNYAIRKLSIDHIMIAFLTDISAYPDEDELLPIEYLSVNDG